MLAHLFLIDVCKRTGNVECQKEREIVKCKCEFVQDRKETHVRRYSDGPLVLAPIAIQREHFFSVYEMADALASTDK